MIEISEQEFEEKIIQVTRGEKTLVGLCKELQTDERTLIQNIMKSSVNNPEIYAEFVEKHPYKTREREDIDFEALLIEILKYRLNSADAARKYNVGVRTIQRRVEKLKQTNPELVAMYREAKDCNKHDQKYSLELQKKIAGLVQRPVIIGEINEQTEKRLEEIERIYNERLLIYDSKEQAAKSMGFTSNKLYKMLNQLYRIKMEKVARSKKDDFRTRVAIDGENNTQVDTSKVSDNSTHSNMEIKEGEGR